MLPPPACAILYVDGPDLGGAASGAIEGCDFDWTMGGSDDQRGFCASTASLWDAAAASGLPLIFWLEGDFLVRRDVDLRDLAAVLAADPKLAQMALCRNAANERERAAGGLVESRPGAFEVEDGWLSHRSYFTTNPSLMRRDFMRDNPFSEAESECEGKFGIELRERGYRFGIWGDGSVGVEHVGVRTGKGY